MSENPEDLPGGSRMNELLDLPHVSPLGRTFSHKNLYSLLTNKDTYDRR